MKIYLLGLAYTIVGMQALYAQNLADSLAFEAYLNEVVVEVKHASSSSMPLALPSQEVNGLWLQKYRAGSLMQSLESLAGVQAMPVGATLSKPMIRGLGFNRIAVVQNGIKHQGQQWGADHGLEINQYAPNLFYVHQGPMSLQIGSDAIGGVLEVESVRSKPKDGVNGDLYLYGGTNNGLLGSVISLDYQRNKNYWSLQMGYQTTTDYKVPTDEFNYLNGQYHLNKGILKNTASRELSVNTVWSKQGKRLNSRLLVSFINSKIGFFAGAHGIPSSIDLARPKSKRSIELPHQRVGHYKAIYNGDYTFNFKNQVFWDLGIQFNDRAEFAKPHSHDDAPLPTTNKELSLKLATTSLNGRWLYKLNRKNHISLGINSELQYNRIGGYSFLIPNYNQSAIGFYLADKYYFRDNLSMSLGVRYDLGYLNVSPYTDMSFDEQYQQRAIALDKVFHDYSFSWGVAWDINHSWSLKSNIGKSFRMPGVNELSVNGVHHGTFRHELGNPNLKPEKSYQWDLNIDYKQKEWLEVLTLNAFINYFPNYIYLNPSGNFSWLPDAGQYFEYAESRVFRWGLELMGTVNLTKTLVWHPQLAYVHAEDMKSKYPIPFTPPLDLSNELGFHKSEVLGLEDFYIGFTHQYKGAQNRVARNELKTQFASLFNLASRITLPLKSSFIKLNFQVQNLLNTTSYNHLSFYRYLNIPEMGRTFRLEFQYSF